MGEEEERERREREREGGGVSECAVVEYYW
jgi:hypothetical protein